MTSLMQPAFSHPIDTPLMPHRSDGERCIRFERVSCVAGTRVVLNGIDLELAQPRIGIIGRNGSGKSMLARCLNGLLLPREGRICIDGYDTRKQGREVRDCVGLVFQSADHQLIMPTVSEDIAFGLQARRCPLGQIKSSVAAILERFDISHLAHRPVSELSGGEKKLVTLLGVLVLNPAYLVLDEPMNGLDLTQRKRFMTLLEGLPQRICLITHELDQLSGFDRVIAMDEGRVVLDGEPSFVIARWKSRYL